MKQPLLFTTEQAPRRKFIKRMRVIDCGVEMVEMECSHCGYENGWESHKGYTISQLKRGWPCPKCNLEQEYKE